MSDVPSTPGYRRWLSRRLWELFREFAWLTVLTPPTFVLLLVVAVIGGIKQVLLEFPRMWVGSARLFLGTMRLARARGESKVKWYLQTTIAAEIGADPLKPTREQFQAIREEAGETPRVRVRSGSVTPVKPGEPVWARELENELPGFGE